jgi:hypothetical protein
MECEDGVGSSKTWPKTKLCIGNYRMFITSSRQSRVGLKRDKATGFDIMMNEYIIFSRQFINPVICKLFKWILNSGSFPELWVKCIVVPVSKKGQPNDPGN